MRYNKYRLSHQVRGDISFIARGTISYVVISECSERGTKYDIVTRATKLISPSLECDNLFKGLIPRQRNSSRETVYAKYGWLHVNNSIEFSLRKKKFRFASE